MSDQDEGSLKLIETIYRTALDPRDYDDFMSQWHDWMNTRMTALEGLKLQDPAMSTPEVAAHFELALRLLERLGERRSEPPQRGAQLLVDCAGKILWQNAEADRRIGQTNGGSKRKTLADLAISESHSDVIQRFLDALDRTPPETPVVVQIAGHDDDRPLAFRVEPMRQGDDTSLALLSALTPTWPIATDRLLMDTHRLSAGEVAICALLVEGLSPAAIADHRRTSLATVRTQLKKILSKTRTKTQPELVAHLFNLMRMAESMPSPENKIALPAPRGGMLHDLTVSNRRMIIEEHGSKDGYPIVFIHGMLDGTGVTEHTQSLLKRHGLRLICPQRPAFGLSEPMTVPVENALTQFAEDLGEVLGKWEVKKPLLLGHMAGSLYAFAAAKTCDAAGIVNVSGGVPIVSTAQFNAMTRRQKLVAYTALHAPSVLPFVVNAGIRQIKSGGGETFMESLYESAPVDRAVLEDDHIRALILNGYEFTVAQGHVGFATDSHHVVRDWTPMFLDSAPVPVHLVHGVHDPVVSVASVREFARKYAGRVALTEAENAGQLVFYQSPDLVLDAAVQMIKAAGY